MYLPTTLKGTLLLWILASLAEQSQAAIRKKRIGTLHSPTAWAHLHVQTDLGALRDVADDAAARLNGFIKAYQRFKAIKDAKEAAQDPKRRFPTHGIRQETLDHVQECIKQIHDHQVLLSKELDAFAQVDTRSRRGLLGFASMATATVALGLGLHNRQQVLQLYEDTKTLASNQKVLLHTLGRVQHELRATTHSLKEWAYQQFIIEEATRFTQDAKMELNEVADRLRQGLVSLLQGRVSLELTRADILKKGWQELTSKAAKYGLSMANVSNPLTILLNTPCTVLFNEGAAHMWIPVPLIPYESKSLEMYQLEHLPILHGELQFQFDLYDRILAVSPDWSLHAEMTAAEMQSCHKIAHDFFCQRTGFLRQRRSCMYSLLHGEKELAAQLCPTTVARRPAFIVTIGNKSEDYELAGVHRRIVSVLINKPTNFTLACPHRPDTYSFMKTSGKQAIPYGCLLRTEEEVVFISRPPHDLHVVEEGKIWTATDLFSNDTLTRLTESQMEARLSESPITLPTLSPLHSATAGTSWGSVVLWTIGSLFAFIVLVDLVARYYALFRHVYQERQTAAPEPECPPSKPTPVDASATHYFAAAPVDEPPSLLALARRCKRARPRSLAL
jgi:hypothetical protein